MTDEIQKNPKFYFFDLGVQRALARTLVVLPKPQTSYYGELFEHWVILEIHRLISYKNNDWRMFYCLSQDPHAKMSGGVRCLPWKKGFNELGLTAHV